MKQMVPDAQGWWWRSCPPSESDPAEDGIPTVEPIWVGGGGLTESGLWYRDCATEAGVDDEPADDGRWLGRVAPPGSPAAPEVRELQRLIDTRDSTLTMVRVALDAAGVPHVEPHPDEPCDDLQHSLRAGGRVVPLDEGVRRLAAERDWLRRALAVEHGDESQAREGWQHGTPGSWHHNGLVGRCGGPEVILRRYGGDDEAEGDLRTDWQRSPRDDGPREAWPFALEAMLAITAEHEARKGGEGG